MVDESVVVRGAVDGESGDVVSDIQASLHFNSLGLTTSDGTLGFVCFSFFFSSFIFSFFFFIPHLSVSPPFID